MEHIKRIDMVIEGRRDSRLVIHAFAEKAKKEIRDKQAKKAKKAKEERNPRQEFLDARYLDAKGRECFPLTCLKCAMVNATRAFDSLKMTEVRQAVFVDSIDSEDGTLCPILTTDMQPAEGTMREDAVTIGMGVRGLTYRPEYPAWRARVSVEFNSRMVSEEQVLGLIDEAGFGVGIGEGRPERKSALSWGRFVRVAE